MTVEGSISRNWPDNKSKSVEKWLKSRGIDIPWKYGDSFGDDFTIKEMRAGGISVVFFVELPQLGNTRYAAKTLQKFLHKDYTSKSIQHQQDLADNFLEEALSWFEMGKHANIASADLLRKIPHPETGRTIPFVFSEFINNGDLREYFRKTNNKINLKEALEILLQICHGLIHAYNQTVTAHKDLKPENILRTEDGVIKVVDFGIGGICTAGYAAPEQIANKMFREERTIDHRADQFAVGIILLEILLGKYPFPDFEVIRRRLDQAGLAKFAEEGFGHIPLAKIPESLHPFINRCLSPKAEKRFPEFSNLKKELLDIYKAEFDIEYQFSRNLIYNAAQWWFFRGESFAEMGRYASAELPFKESLKFLKLSPDTGLDQTSCLINLGNVYTKISKYREAETILKEALTILKSIPNSGLYRAHCLMNLGNLYQSTSKYLDAIEFYKEALGLYKLLYKNKDQAKCLLNIGVLLSSISKFPDAEKSTGEALKFFESIPATETEQALCYLNLGNICKNTGNYLKAEEHYSFAFDKFCIIPGKEVEKAICIESLGNIYEMTGKFMKALECYQRAFERFKIIPGNEFHTAECLLSSGGVYYSLGRFIDAEAACMKAFDVFRTIPDTLEKQTACLKNLGMVYKATGDLCKAKGILEKALNFYKSIDGLEQEHGLCLNSLGVVYKNMGRLEDAERCYNEALYIFEDIPELKMEKARCTNNLANIYKHSGRFIEAEKKYREALDIYSLIPGADIPKARCLMAMGNLFEMISDFKKAKTAFRESLAICEKFKIGTEEIRANSIRSLAYIDFLIAGGV